jgi:hypothetical protein
MMNKANQESLIDEALDTYPIAPLPPGFVRRVMNRVHARQPVMVPERFQLDIVDIAVPLFITLFVVMLMVIAGTSDMADIVELQMSGLFNATAFGANWLIILLLVLAGEIGTGTLVYLWLWGEQS